MTRRIMIQQSNGDDHVHVFMCVKKRGGEEDSFCVADLDERFQMSHWSQHLRSLHPRTACPTFKPGVVVCGRSGGICWLFLSISKSDEHTWKNIFDNKYTAYNISCCTLHCVCLNVYLFAYFGIWPKLLIQKNTGFSSVNEGFKTLADGEEVGVELAPSLPCCTADFTDRSIIRA